MWFLEITGTAPLPPLLLDRDRVPMLPHQCLLQPRQPGRRRRRHHLLPALPALHDPRQLRGRRRALPEVPRLAQLHRRLQLRLRDHRHLRAGHQRHSVGQLLRESVREV